MSVNVPGYGRIMVDISYGGAFYAVVPVSQYNMDTKSSIQKIKDAAGATTGIQLQRPLLCCMFSFVLYLFIIYHIQRKKILARANLGHGYLFLEQEPNKYQ